MAAPVPASLAPRKRPRQARAAATLDAIFEATIQVLLRDGMHRLTTTRVAERAGVSVGTMYQYFPHKRSLVYALNERYLQGLSDTIQAACRNQHGAPLDEMVAALVDTYWVAKTARPEVTRALYRSVSEIDNEAMIENFARRVDAATAAMLASAPEANFPDLESVNLTLVAVIFGTVRYIFERNLAPHAAEGLRLQLVLMCRSYLNAAKA